MSIPQSVPTRADVEDLHRFLQDRGEEQWQRDLIDEALPGDRFDAARRLNNSHKLSLGATAAAAVHALNFGDDSLASAMWHVLTSCGEQWNDHPAWRSAWRNPARAALEANLS